MNGSIHRERTASEPQDRSSSVAHSIEVPSEIIRKWQEFVNLLAEIMHVPSAAIMRADPPHIKVFVSSTSKGNPCEPGALDTGPYCETVMKTGQPLLVPDALENEAWKANPHVRAGMISYLGVPIGWPDGRLFGTICVRDNKRNEYSEAYLKLLLHFRDTLQADLNSLVRLHGEIEEREAKIRRSEAYLAEAQILSHTGSWAHDPVTEKIRYWSAGCYRIWGFDPAHGLPDSLVAHERIHPDDRDRVWEEAMEARRQKRDYATEFRIVLPDGTVKYIEGIIHHVISEEGELIELVGTNADVTDRRRAEEALRESEAKFRAAIDGIAGLVAIMAPSGELEAVNGPIIEYFGRTVEELKNWGTGDAVHPEDLPRVLESYKTSLATGTPFLQELRLRRFDGEYRWFENRGAPIRDESGRIARWYCLLVDVEDRTRALERLQQLQSDFAHMNRVSMMGELAASLSHEITQPIASARNNARAAQNFLHKQTPDLREVEEALGCIVADADRAGNIVDRIREHIKKAPPRMALCDLNAAINEVVVLARSAIVQNGISVQRRLAEGLSHIHGDRVQLQQVVLNLILNAVEAMGSSKA